jgi:hypothetical protein
MASTAGLRIDGTGAAGEPVVTMDFEYDYFHML